MALNIALTRLCRARVLSRLRPDGSRFLDSRPVPTPVSSAGWPGPDATSPSGLIVLGGVVRITGSGMGCGDHWPRCDGEWFPPLDLPTLIEIGHRWAAALVSLLVLAVALVAWRRHRAEPRAPRRRPPSPLVLLVVQVLLGAVTVKLALPPWVDHHPPGQRDGPAGHAPGGRRSGPARPSGPAGPLARATGATPAGIGWCWRPPGSASW